MLQKVTNAVRLQNKTQNMQHKTLRKNSGEKNIKDDKRSVIS